MMMQAQSVATEYFGKILDRHMLGHSENDIRSAFRDFLVRTGIATDESEITTETKPASDSRLKVDLYIRNTYVEFKRDIIRAGVIDPEYIDQLDEYILENAQAGNGIQNGILTDGVNYLKRSVGDHLRPIILEARHTVFSESSQGDRLYEYVYDIIDTQATDIAPSDANLTRYFGVGSAVFNTATALLTDAHKRTRDISSVEVKRKLWKELLQVALGQDAVDDSNTSDWLYVRHTYLTSLVGVIVQAHFEMDVERYARENPTDLLNGEILRQNTGLKGIIESDLFTWPLEVDQTEYLRTIARQVAKFDWQKNPGDLAAILYQNTITPEEREQMGEYYTPPWLTKSITEELITDPASTKVLDPACGSGTFIASAVQHIIANTQHMPPKQRLAKLQENVAGIDLHPVAVQLAKATWVINSHPVIMDARNAGQGGEEIVAPIHLGDSLQLRYDNSRLIGQRYIELRTGEILEGQTNEVVFQVPLDLARQVYRFDNLMLSIANAIDRDDETDRVLDEHGITEDSERGPLETTITNMKALHAAGRNHVWAYYLRNMTRPAVISEQKVDAIIGNPPWLTYNQSANIIRDELKSISQNLYQIWAGGKNSANQDVATLFYCRVMELYLKQGGNIGMVLPHSALRSGQHLKWRSGYYEAKNPPRSGEGKRAISADFTIKNPWDLSVLEPKDFFPIAGCVVFASFGGSWGDFEHHKKTAKPLAPGEVETWNGATGSPDVERVVTALIHDNGTFRSPYADLSSRGADVFDRRLYFVTAYPNDGMFAIPNTRKTYPATGGQDKKKYSVDELKDFVIDDNNIFDVYLGESLAPYVALPPRTAVLPVSMESMTLPLNHSECRLNPKTGKRRHNRCAIDRQALKPNMRSRWEIMERLWDENKGKTDKKTLVQNLNWLNKLTSQLESLRLAGPNFVRIAYTTSGRPTAALITDNKAILDTTLYQVVCNSLDEAHYILAVINSVALEDAVDPFRPKGLYGTRHVHKHPWKLPIPRYDPANEVHDGLSQLGRSAAKSANELVSAMENQTVTVVRRELRGEWQVTDPTAAAIETAVAELLESGRMAICA